MLDKKVILITGGSEGLGYETAKILVSLNTVIIASENEESLKKAAADLNCAYYVCDVRKIEHIKETVADIIAKHGRIDCLVNNAGIFLEGKLEENPIERIRNVVDVNIFGLIAFTREVVPQMKKQKRGLIINISSIGGLYAKSEKAVYNASKFAVTGFTRAMESELKGDGIRVTGIFPDRMRTKLFEKAGLHRDFSQGTLEPSEVAKSIAFIVSMPETTVITELGIKHIDK